MIACLFSFFIITYCLFMVFLWLGWERISIISNDDFKDSVAIIIAIRNEEHTIKNLVEDLLSQSYKNLEIIIVDDHSEDDSNNVIAKVIKKNTHIRLLSLTHNAGKKAAIAYGIKHTNANIVLTTDGDCRIPPTWVKTMVASFNQQTQFVSGPVKFQKESNFFKKLQSVEFASLIGSGASFVGWNKPIMANGANMGFRRKAFLEVHGYDGNSTTASGDDVFLLHKIAKNYPNLVEFVKQEGAIIKTAAQPTIKLFVQQRIRWASKWKVYTDTFTKSIAVLVFLVSLSLLILPILVLLQKTSLFLWLNLLVIKSFFDFFFIRQVTYFLGDRVPLMPFIILQLFYPFYIVFTALFSLKKSYYWKGRKVK